LNLIRKNKGTRKFKLLFKALLSHENFFKKYTIQSFKKNIVYENLINFFIVLMCSTQISKTVLLRFRKKVVTSSSVNSRPRFFFTSIDVVKVIEKWREEPKPQKFIFKSTRSFFWIPLGWKFEWDAVKYIEKTCGSKNHERLTSKVPEIPSRFLWNKSLNWTLLST